jgi:hypothetical protein
VHAKHVRHIGRCSILGTRFALTTVIGMTVIGMTVIGMTVIGMTVIGMTVIGMTVIGMTVIGMTQPKTAVKRVTAMTEQVLNLCVQTERLETVR